MSSALIGYSGFVGGSLDRQAHFDEKYNSKNISEIKGKYFELIACAGTPGVKWKANQNPEEDLQAIQSLRSHLETVSCDLFIFISTVDVYFPPVEVAEDSPVPAPGLPAYGLHRFQFEEFVRQRYNRSLTVRLPGLYGEGLKKNFIYDLLNENALDWTDARSYFQFYNLDRLWEDIQTLLPHEIPLVNFATPPVNAQEVAELCFGVPFENHTERGAVFYDMHTNYAALFGQKGRYMCTKKDELDSISQFVKRERRKRKSV